MEAWYCSLFSFDHINARFAQTIFVKIDEDGSELQAYNWTKNVQHNEWKRVCESGQANE